MDRGAVVFRRAGTKSQHRDVIAVARDGRSMSSIAGILIDTRVSRRERNETEGPATHFFALLPQRAGSISPGLADARLNEHRDAFYAGQTGWIIVFCNVRAGTRLAGPPGMDPKKNRAKREPEVRIYKTDNGTGRIAQFLGRSRIARINRAFCAKGDTICGDNNWHHDFRSECIPRDYFTCHPQTARANFSTSSQKVIRVACVTSIDRKRKCSSDLIDSCGQRTGKSIVSFSLYIM